MRYADPAAQAEIDRLRAENAWAMEVHDRDQQFIRGLQRAYGAAPAALRFLAKCREEYFHGKEPEHMGDIEAMSATDLTLWTEVKTAEQLANYLEHPGRAWGWLPSWRWDEWERMN